MAKTKRCPRCGCTYTDYGAYRELCLCDGYEDDPDNPDGAVV